MKVRPTLPLLIIFFALLASALPPRAARTRQSGPGASQQAASPEGEPYYALVIGNDDYNFLPKLTTSERDARAVARMLRETYGFETTLLVNATRSEMVASLSGYRRTLGAEASLLVYYAGRGRRDGEGGKAYWLPVDATRENASGWISADEVTAAVRSFPARHVLVVSDSCYSGTLPHALGVSQPRGDERVRLLQKMAAGRSRTLMASGGEEPWAYEEGGGHSAFALTLLRGLRQMDAQRFTAAELFVAYVLAPVAGRTGRMPAYNPLRDSGHEGGDFVFTRVKPRVVPSSCDDPEAKAKLYQSWLDNFKGNPEQQKAAYEAGKEYVSRYGSCPDEDDKKVVVYIGHWLAKYEEAVRQWERSRSRRP